jgi:hypothetical protein
MLRRWWVTLMMTHQRRPLQQKWLFEPFFWSYFDKGSNHKVGNSRFEPFESKTAQTVLSRFG